MKIMLLRFNFIMSLVRRFSYGLIVIVTIGVLVAPVLADVCVWRDPERTMVKLFPEATDYETITISMKPETIAQVEKVLGAPLEEDEKHEFNFYELKALRDGKPSTLGYAIALAGKGEYGAIEIVIGIDQKDKILAAYLQRSREKNRKELEDILAKVAGHGTKMKLALGNLTKSQEVIQFTIQKMFAFYEVLLNQNKENLK